MSSLSIQYPPNTIKRAQIAFLCSPFKLHLFITMVSKSVPLLLICGQTGLDKGYTQRSLSELGAESELVWLIKVGLLRREVDGQGITDSFRLTPLGRQIIKQTQNSEKEFPPANWYQKLTNILNRWLRLPV